MRYQIIDLEVSVNIERKKIVFFRKELNVEVKVEYLIN